MAEYYNVTTNLGDAEIANAIATNTKLNITHIAFGDGNGSVPTPSKTRTSLVSEVHRQAVTKYERHPTNANWIVIETIIPSDVGGFTIREMGIIANGKFISHGSHAPFEKVADPSGVSEYRIRFTQNVTDGSVVELTLDESLIYATQAWIDENYIPRSEIADNLTTNDAAKVASARTVKELQDSKFDKNALNNTLTSTSTDQALTAAQGKALLDRFKNSRLENGHQEINGTIFQWFTLTINPSGAFYYNTYSFFKAFPNNCFAVFAVPGTKPNGGLLNTTGPISITNCLPIDATTFQLRLDTNASLVYSGTNKIKIFAVGY